MSNNPFVPPAAEGLPLAALDSATEGANALDAWAADPYGRNFLAHALVQLARDGWLRQEAGEGFEPVRDREAPDPEEQPASAAVSPPPADRGAVLAEAADHLARQADELWAPDSKAHTVMHADADELRRVADEAQQWPKTETPVGYSGKGRVWCVSCPRPDDEDVPLTIQDVDHWSLCPGCGRHVVDVARGAQQPETPEVVHGCPPDGSGLTPCCGRTPFELPLGDRISSEAPTTCKGPQS